MNKRAQVIGRGKGKRKSERVKKHTNPHEGIRIGDRKEMRERREKRERKNGRQGEKA